MQPVRWTYQGQNARDFLQLNQKCFRESPGFRYRDIDFVLYLYPRGYTAEHHTMIIWLNSKGELPPDILPDFKITCRCQLAIRFGARAFHWDDSITLQYQSSQNLICEQLRNQINISFLHKLAQSKIVEPISFQLTLFDEPYDSYDGNGDEEEVENKSNQNHNLNLQHMPSPIAPTQQILTTTPTFTSSQLYSHRFLSESTNWRIPGSQMPLFLNTKISESLDSPIFDLANGSQWKLVIYPNGVKEKPHSVALFLECIRFPDVVDCFTLIIDAHCVETDTYSCNTFVFGAEVDDGHPRMKGRRNSVPVWAPYTMETDQLKYMMGLEFVITLTLIQAQYTAFARHIHPNSKGVGFIQRIIAFQPVYHYSKIEWILPLSPMFLNARYGKLFVSPRFGIWCIRARPNANEHGLVQFELYLVTHPSGISELEVEFKLDLPQFPDIKTNVQRPAFKLGDHKWFVVEGLFLKLQQLAHHNQLVVRGQLSFIKQCNRRGDEVEIAQNPHDDIPVQQDKAKEEEDDKKVAQHAKELLALQNKLAEMENVMNMLQTQQTEKSKEFQKFRTFESNQKYDGYVYDDEEIDDGLALQLWFEKQLKMPQYYQVFLTEGWDDLETIKKALKEQDLKSMGIEKAGHRMKILQHIQAMKEVTKK